MNPYVEAGARVIFKRALAELGIGKGMAGISTEELVTHAIAWDAPVIMISRRWVMVASGKPALTPNERELMVAQAVTARLWWMQGKQKARRKNAKDVN
jgi:hypothetical protein